MNPIVKYPGLMFTECIRLLLHNNADPKVEDEDGTTPMELAKDDVTKALLHDAVIDADSKRDAVGRSFFIELIISIMLAYGK